MGCVLGRHPLSVSIVADGRGAVGKTEFEQDAPPGGFRHFDQSETKKKYIGTASTWRSSESSSRSA